MPCGQAVSCVQSTNPLGVFPFLVCIATREEKSGGGGRVEVGKEELSTVSHRY
jgi:hypothetical protein